MPSAAVTLIVTVLVPVDHVAAAPLFTTVSPTVILICAPASAGVAVIVFVVFVVVAVYVVVADANAGVSVRLPILISDSVASVDAAGGVTFVTLYVSGCRSEMSRNKKELLSFGIPFAYTFII